VFLLDVDAIGGNASAEGVGRFIECDVTDSRAVHDAMESIGLEAGRLDVLVNNAGGFALQMSTSDVPVDEWRRIIDTRALRPWFGIT
jgi:NAD(P)-dependent dehydrogenase (short-subunit alcohol dehydrogenase family)